MGVDLRQVVDALAGESRQHMGDARLVLAHHYGAAFAQQLVVLQKRSGYGVFDCHDAEQRCVGVEHTHHLRKRIAGHGLNLLALEVRAEIRPCCGIVKASRYTLDRHPSFILHILSVSVIQFYIGDKSDCALGSSDNVPLHLIALAERDVVMSSVESVL